MVYPFDLIVRADIMIYDKNSLYRSLLLANYRTGIYYFANRCKQQFLTLFNFYYRVNDYVVVVVTVYYIICCNMMFVI